MDADGGCKEAVRKLQAAVAVKLKSVPSSSTAAYCKARKKLELSTLESIHQHLSDQLKIKTNPDCLNGRRIIVVDGTGISMPDTEENQKIWPQQSGQKPGCSFPQATICACFNLHNGALLSYEVGNKKSHELPMLRKQWNIFKADDIFLGDKGFCSYYDQSNLKDRGVDSIITLARRTPVVETEAIKTLGENDLLIHWKKPKRNNNSSYSQADLEALPEKLLLRQIKVIVNKPGFRCTSFYIITTLLDSKAYPASEIAEVYFQRWDVELFFRDIKTTMDMDILRCKTPEMVRKEILMHLIVYNCIRALIAEAAKTTVLKTRRISFKGSVQALRQWEPYLNSSSQELNRLIQLLYQSIIGNVVIERPGRSEPRAIKRRPKNYQRLNKPRHEMNPIPHRNKYQAQNP
ncbi:MAG: IS4 family transposase [Mariprofundaceae bacterium]